MSVQTCDLARFTWHHGALPTLFSRYAALPQPPYICPIDVSYNNVFLINAVNLVVIGEALQDLGYGPNAAAAATSGYVLLDSWFDYASSNGALMRELSFVFNVLFRGSCLIRHPRVHISHLRMGATAGEVMRSTCRDGLDVNGFMQVQWPSTHEARPLCFSDVCSSRPRVGGTCSVLLQARQMLAQQLRK